MFQDTYRTMNRRLTPPAELVRATLEQATSGRTIRPRRSFLRRTVLAGAVLAACLCAVPAAAAVWNPAYQMFYQISPAAAQFFQPVQTSCTDQDITMTVSAVRVEGDTAQAYITFSGGSVDETTDLFDSWSFHLPFDQTGSCEQVHWDEETGTVTFLCTTQTMDGSPISAGSKMTVSARQLLTGKETRKDTAVDIALEDYAEEAPTLASPGGSDDPFSRTGGSGEETLLEIAPLLLPGEILGRTCGGALYHGGRIRRRLLPHSALPGKCRADGQPRPAMAGRSGGEQAGGSGFRWLPQPGRAPHRLHGISLRCCTGGPLPLYAYRRL